MVKGTMCPRHLTRRSTQTCRRCAKPLCDLCEREFGARFCSSECAQAFADFQEKVVDGFAVRRRRFSLFGCLRTAVISCILLIITFLALWKLTGTTDPAQMWTEIRRMLNILL